MNGIAEEIENDKHANTSLIFKTNLVTFAKWLNKYEFEIKINSVGLLGYG